jgi:C-terminal processing protease CtpA/Prc
MTLVKSDGTTVVVRVAPGGTLKPPPQITAADALNVPTALFRKHQDSYYWYEHLPESKALYVQYNRCANDPQQPFSEFTKELFAFADAHPVDRVVVDLRLNGGGNSQVIAPLISGLRSRPALSARGRLYAIIGRGTFSSGLLAAMNFRDDLHAILVGEPLGEKPNSYGEVRQLTLPNSQLVVQYSTKFFRLVANGDPPAYVPDVLAPRSLADALAGRDPALEAALAHALR